MNSIAALQPESPAAAPRPARERYARGWHCLGLAADYRDGKPLGVNLFGTRVVVFQAEDGQLRVLDAWCPHMGADLALGHVAGNALVCKFHGWHWGGNGACSHIPYARSLPPKARIKAWPLCEQNRLLFIWNDPEGNAPTPELAIPRIDAAFSEEWSSWSMVKWTIDNNCRELIDNIADMAHFEPVHGFNRVLYFADLFEGHKATQVMVGANDRLGGADDHLTSIATYFGPAYQITHMSGAMGGVPVESVLVNSHTPIDHKRFELRFGVMVRRVPGMTEQQCAATVQAYVERTTQAFAEDVEIWHNKVRIDQPLLCDGDGPVYQNRRWYEQFYLDAAAVPAELCQRRVVEIDRGLGRRPALHHAFEPAA